MFSPDQAHAGSGDFSGSVETIYKDQAALTCGQNYPANAINCL